MNKKTLAGNARFLSLLAGCLLLGAGFAFAAGNAGYVGSEKCKECHEEVSASHAKSLHAKAWSNKGSGYGCESCHGAAGNHVGNPSKENIIGFGKESKTPADVQSKQCLECHAASSSLAVWDMGKHKKEDVSCAACHNIHKDKSPAAKDPETCFGCHKDIKRDANKQSHHPLVEGKIKCSSCHNPHGTLTHGMIKADNVNQLCYKCHADKRGPYLWEHAPVEENCLICHDSHGTKASKLMKEKIPNLCQECHDSAYHTGGTPFDATAGFTGANKNNRFYGRSCVNCHTAIHGSYAPEIGDSTNSGRLFLR